jgi:hypothetical protein
MTIFPKHFLFNSIYSLQKHKLNHSNYYELEINMIYFTQAQGYDMNIHAKFQYLILYICLKLITSRFGFLGFYIRQYCTK